MSNLLLKYRIFHENKQFLSSIEMCCFICFHLKVDFSVQWCTAREQVCCDFMLFVAPQATLHLTYEALIQLHFDYCSSVWELVG